MIQKIHPKQGLDENNSIESENITDEETFKKLKQQRKFGIKP